MTQLKYLILLLFLGSSLLAQENFTVSYNFDGSYAAQTSNPIAFTAEDAVIGGSHLSNPGFSTLEGQGVLQSSVNKNNATNYTNTYLKMNIKAKSGYDVVINSVYVKHSAALAGGSYQYRIGTTLNNVKPALANRSQTTDNVKFNSTSLVENTYFASSTFARAKENNYATVWVCAKGPSDIAYQWSVDQVVIKGQYIKTEDEAGVNISLTQDKRQKLRLGIDAERLWYFTKGEYGKTLAELGVKEINSEFVRVAVNCAYELEEGTKQPETYDKIIGMMTYMKEANPDIKFFASPRPLDEAYTTAQGWEVWGAPKPPWSPAPPWVITWVKNGTTVSDGETVQKWKFNQVKIDKLTQYYADYLNLMHSHGFKIDFLDITNEFNQINASYCKYLYDIMPSLLDQGVYMPELVAPSAWNYSQGVNYLNSFTTDQRSSFSIAACHNTNQTGTPTAFAKRAVELGKEPWESELHGWTGIAIEEEVINSSYFWDHLRAGFVGIDTWLFYGPKNGKDHTMLWANSNSYVKSSKYEIFKHAVNNGNGGNYVDVDQPENSGIHSAATLKGNVLMLWVLNTSKFIRPQSTIDFGQWNVQGQNAAITVYNASNVRAGKTMSLPLSSSSLTLNLEAASLYAFKVELPATSTKDILEQQVQMYPNPTTRYVHFNESVAKIRIFNLAGQFIRSFQAENNKVDISSLAKGIYIVDNLNAKGKSLTIERLIKR